MKLFGEKDQQAPPANPNSMLLIRLLAVVYLGYCLWQIIQMYIQGGEDAPSVPLLICAIVVLGGGAVWVAIATYRQYKRQQAEAQQAEAAEETED